jgi:oligopeptide/dipeptide ABC transporter ATP-binding protein
MPARELVKAEQVSVSFEVRRAGWRRHAFQAVRAVDLSIGEGEVLALVGESGSGKTTLGRALLRLIDVSAGTIQFRGQPITGLAPAALRPLRCQMQIIFQDPFASLDPRMRVGDIIGEGLRIHGVGNAAARAARVAQLLSQVGLQPAHAWRFPHALSGGQRQRVGIARALALNPSFIVADEPVSSLDVSVQAQIINLLYELKEQLSLTLLFITHNLGVVRMIADRVAVMYLGRIVEIAPTESLFERPAHPYTQTLLASIPLPDPNVRFEPVALPGEMPSVLNPPSGCAFRTRCTRASAQCAAAAPPLDNVRGREGHSTACWHSG